jgi:DNA-binding transcriptional MerR regulator
MYSISDLAELAGVTIKTLRHYDKIELLKPKLRKESGYRYYGREEMLRLQQILFFKELDFPLNEIKLIMNDRSYNPLIQLKLQKQNLLNKVKRYKKLLCTIDKTINEFENNQGNEIMITDEELYEGFSKEQSESYRKEAIERWGADEVLQTEMNIKKLGKEGWKLLKQKGEKINLALAKLMDKYPEHPDVQEQIIIFHDYLDNFYQVSPERLLCLGKMYVEDKRFTDNYEKYRPGLAIFLNKAIEYYVSEKIWMKRNKK